MAEEEKARPKGQDDGSKPSAGATQAVASKSGEEEKKFEGFLAEVVSVEGSRTGIYGEIKQAMCKILEGRDRGRVIRRNFAGRIKKGDMVRLPDTSREDKKIMAR